MQREKTQACLTKGSYAGCQTRCRGLESHLLHVNDWSIYITPLTFFL